MSQLTPHTSTHVPHHPSPVRSSVLALDIGRNRIGAAIASRSSDSVLPLDPIEYSRRRPARDRNARATFGMSELLANSGDVRALLIGWPTGTDGRLGRACGAVLHLLDHFSSQSPALLRSFCLWEDRVDDPAERMDRWGRAECFARVRFADIDPKREIRYDDDEAFRTGDSSTASRMLKAFMDEHVAKNGEEWNIPKHEARAPCENREEEQAQVERRGAQINASYHARRKILCRATLVA